MSGGEASLLEGVDAKEGPAATHCHNIRLTEAEGSPGVPGGSKLLLPSAEGPPPRPAHDCTTTTHLQSFNALGDSHHNIHGQSLLLLF